MDIPADYFHVIASDLTPDGEYGAVLSATNEPPRVEHYVDICGRTDDGWKEFAAWGWGPGWGYAYSGVSDGFVVAVSDVAPDDARGAVVQFDGVEHRVPVRNGWVFFVGFSRAEDPSVEFEGFY